MVVNTVAGGGSEDGLPAIEAHQSPDGHMILGPDGTIYFVSHNQIWSISPDGTLHLLAGTGLTNFNGDGPALNCNLNPGGLARDAAGNLYFSDRYLIRKLSGGVVTSIAGNGLPASYTTDGDALSIPVDYGASVAVNGAGDVYIAEVSAMRVRKISRDGQISLFAGAQQPFLTLYSSPLPDDGDGGPATLAHLNGLMDIAVDPSGNVLIAEPAAIRRVSTGGIIGTLATAPSIAGIALDPAGNVYYRTENIDSPASGIYKLQSGAAATQILSTEISIDSFGLDAASNLYYATGPLYKVTGSTTQEIAGRGTYSSPDGTVATSAVISPVAITVDSAGRVIFEDPYCLLRRINSDGTLVTIAGTGTCAGATPASGPALSTAIVYASHIASGGGMVFIAGSNSSLEWLDSNGNIQLLAPPEANGIAADSTGTAWIGGDNQLLKFTPGNAPVTIQPPPTFIGPGIAKAITTDRSGNVYVVFYNDGAVPEEGWILSGGSDWTGRFNTPADLVNNLCMNGAATYFAASRGLYQFTPTSSASLGLYYGMSGDGGPVVSAYFGYLNDIACDASGNIYVNDDPNARIREISGKPPSAAPVISANGVVNSASYSGTGIAPMELVSIFGQSLAPALQVASVVNNYIATALGDVQVTFDGDPAPLLAVSPTQINAVVPGFESDCSTGGSARVQVWVDGVSSAIYNAPCAPAAPALFSADMSGKGPGAILNQDGSINSAANPAARGSVISLYGTGAGVLDTVLYDGYLDLSIPYGNVTLPVTVTIGGEDAAVQYAGGAPYLIDGAVQINATVPADITPGNVTVTVSVGGVASNAVQVWTR